MFLDNSKTEEIGLFISLRIFDKKLLFNFSEAINFSFTAFNSAVSFRSSIKLAAFSSSLLLISISNSSSVNFGDFIIVILVFIVKQCPKIGKLFCENYDLNYILTNMVGFKGFKGTSIPEIDSECPKKK